MLSYCTKHRLYQAGPVKRACPFCEDEQAVAKRRAIRAQNSKNKRGKTVGPKRKKKGAAPPPLPDRLMLHVLGKPDWAARLERIEESWYE